MSGDVRLESPSPKTDHSWSATTVRVPSGASATKASKFVLVCCAYSECMENISVFVTGGTGYIGTPLIRMLLDRGHKVRALVRPSSDKKLPALLLATHSTPIHIPVAFRRR